MTSYVPFFLFEKTNRRYVLTNYSIIKKKIYIWPSSMIMIYDNLFATISASIKIDTVILYGNFKHIHMYKLYRESSPDQL